MVGQGKASAKPQTFDFAEEPGTCIPTVRPDSTEGLKSVYLASGMLERPTGDV